MEINYWENPMSTKKPIETTTIDVFLDRVKNGYWKHEAEKIRTEKNEEKRKALKKSMPCVTVSGIFRERKESELTKHSGFICIDIDGFNDKKQLEADQYTYSVINSIGGNGLAVIVKIEPAKHKESYRFLSEYYFNLFGIKVDEAPKNPASCRYVTFDTDLFINPKAKKSKFKIDKPKRVNTLALIIPKSDVGELVNQVNQNVAENYEDYLKLGFACATGFGENGRDYFHKLCMFSAKYDSNVVDRNYTRFLKGSNQGITIGTFYYYLKQGGADLTTYQSDKQISEIALNKRLNVSKVESVQKLLSKTKLDEKQAIELVDEVYSRNDIDIRNSGGVENIINNVQNFIYNYHKIRKNIITKKYEIDGEEMKDKHFNDLYLKSRLTFDDNAVTFDLVVRIIMSSATPEFNPIQQYIEKNSFRNSTGNIQKICDSIISNTSMKKTWITKWLLSLIACYEGHPVRSVLCLTGGQNTGKTEFFRRLMPPALRPYYAESNMDKGKDDELLMCENLIVMDDEMGGKSKQDEKRFKELTSKNFFSLRAPYAKSNEHFKRLALLCGTTNEKAVINDPTGNTRILPIEVESINHELYNSVNKDELFMELYREYTSGAEWQLDKEEVKILMYISEEFETIPFERELILKLFEVPEGNFHTEMTATEIKDWIESNTKQKIMSMKKLGTELKKLFGNPISTRRGRCYQVVQKFNNNTENTSWIE
jgi:predicted P-loop ATPase